MKLADSHLRMCRWTFGGTFCRELVIFFSLSRSSYFVDIWWWWRGDCWQTDGPESALEIGTRSCLMFWVEKVYWWLNCAHRLFPPIGHVVEYQRGRGMENMCQLLFSSHYYGLLGCYFGYERDIKHFVVLLRFVYVISLSIGCFGLTAT